MKPSEKLAELVAHTGWTRRSLQVGREAWSAQRHVHCAYRAPDDQRL